MIDNPKLVTTPFLSTKLTIGQPRYLKALQSIVEHYPPCHKFHAEHLIFNDNSHKKAPLPILSILIDFSTINHALQFKSKD